MNCTIQCTNPIGPLWISIGEFKPIQLSQMIFETDQGSVKINQSWAELLDLANLDDLVTCQP